jgi:hypothetical protein
MEAYKPSSFWYSKINDFRRCPQYYKRRHIDGDKVDEKSGDLEFGTAMHLGLNEILSGGDGAGLFNVYWDSVKGQGLEFGRNDWAALKEIAEVLLARFERLHAKHLKPFQMEERIFGKISGHDFEGTPDFLGSYKDVPSVVDFKTAGYRYDKFKIRCDDQMAAYAHLAKEVHGFEAKQKVYIVLIKDPKAPSIQVVQEDLTSSIISDTITNVADTCETIKNTQRFYKNPAGCVIGGRVCPYFQSCFPGSETNE